MAVKKGTKRKTSTTKKKKQTATEEGRIGFELLFWILLALMLLLVVSNFGFGGVVGNTISSFFFGLFGLMSYIFPFVVFFAIFFYLSNRDHPLIVRKILGIVLLFIFLCVFLQLIAMGPYLKTTSITEYYRVSASDHIGGGLIGGLIAKAFHSAFSLVGAYILTIAGILISGIIITQQSLLGFLRRNSMRAAALASERRQAAKERIRIRRAERAAQMKAAEKEKKKRPAFDIRFNDAEEEDVNEISFAPEIEAPVQETDSIESALKAYAVDERPVPVPFAEETIETPAQSVSAAPAPDTPMQDEKINRADVQEATAAVSEEIKRKTVKRHYKLPPLSLLTRGGQGASYDRDQLRQTAAKLETVLQDFGVNVHVTNVSHGPSVTRYELMPEQGVKVSKITDLANDIQLSLAARSIRIEAPIPGKSAVGIEVPNTKSEMVLLGDLLVTKEFKDSNARLTFAVGKDLAGKSMITNIERMPHLLIAGATGSGKSVCINTLIMSVLYKSTPEEVKMIMIDPKVVELKIYNEIPHLMIPVVTDPKKAAGALNWAVAEMTQRYNKFAEMSGVRDIHAYNERIDELNAANEEPLEKMPQILIVVDELADLMMVAKQEVEDAICRLAQLARAAGIHLILATQRPSVNVVTGLIKANMPSRIAFAVSSGTDSRTIIDMNGAEKLLGNGDMLFAPQDYAKPVRMQGAYVSDEDIEKTVSFLKAQAGPAYDEDVAMKITQATNNTPAGGYPGSGGDGDRDEYYADAGRFIIEKKKASIGMLQRMFKIGFNRAARIMDQLCEAGVVGEEEGTKPRTILMTLEEFEQSLQAER